MSEDSNGQHAIIGSDSGFVPHRQMALSESLMDELTDAYMHHSSSISSARLSAWPSSYTRDIHYILTYYKYISLCLPWLNKDNLSFIPCRLVAVATVHQTPDNDLLFIE